MEHSKYYYDHDRNDLLRKSPFVTGLIDDVDILDNNSSILNNIEDRIELKIDNNNGRWKYREDEILKEIQEYLGGTYNAHYTSKESKTQTLDLIESIGDAEAFCRSNAIKYLSRFGKKNGKSRLDILKAIHYCVLLYNFSGVLDQKGDYETF